MGISFDDALQTHDAGLDQMMVESHEGSLKADYAKRCMVKLLDLLKICMGSVIRGDAIYGAVDEGIHTGLPVFLRA